MAEFFRFPDGFLWGAATSAHQVEGGNHNDWSEWESANAERLARESESKFGLLPNWGGIKAQAQDPANYISGRACNHYHRFREDFDIAQKLGHNAHRFSIEWSRIEPEERKFDEKEIEHYREVIRALRERGMEPFVTLWHWTIPRWLRDRGGITCREFPEFFGRFAERVVGSFQDEVRYWMTLNEPTSVLANSYLRGTWPPQAQSWMRTRTAAHRLAEAHRRAYALIHHIQPDAAVGFGNILVFAEPASRNTLDGAAAAFRRYLSNSYFFSLTGDTHDYLALQYYFHFRVRFPQTIQNANERVSDMGWELYPEGHYHLLKELAAYEKPIFITESGLADAADSQRAQYIRESLRAISHAVREGVDVRGYFHWSLLDNFEWDKGLWPRFGLVGVDYKTLERKIRPSAWEYKKIIDTNAVEIMPH